MRLLSKSDVAKAKSVEMRQAIDEGTKLAKRVDTLRELSAQEEKTLAQWRVKTLAAIHEEITREEQKLVPLKAEVHDLEDRRKEALRPLTVEHDRIATEQAFLDRKREEADARESVLRSKEQSVDLDGKRARTTLTRATLKESDADRRLHEAATQAEEARVALAHAQKVDERAAKKERELSNTLLHRDQMASSRERSVTIKEAEIAQKAKLLEIERLQLKDQRETLERAFKRLDKKHVTSK